VKRLDAGALVSGRSRDRAGYGRQRCCRGLCLSSGCCVGRRRCVPGGLDAESGIASDEQWTVRSTLGSVAVHSIDATLFRYVAERLLLPDV